MFCVLCFVFCVFVSYLGVACAELIGVDVLLNVLPPPDPELEAFHREPRDVRYVDQEEHVAATPRSEDRADEPNRVCQAKVVLDKIRE